MLIIYHVDDLTVLNHSERSNEYEAPVLFSRADVGVPTIIVPRYASSRVLSAGRRRGDVQ